MLVFAGAWHGWLWDCCGARAWAVRQGHSFLFYNFLQDNLTRLHLPSPERGVCWRDGDFLWCFYLLLYDGHTAGVICAVHHFWAFLRWQCFRLIMLTVGYKTHLNRVCVRYILHILWTITLYHFQVNILLELLKWQILENSDYSVWKDGATRISGKLTPMVDMYANYKRCFYSRVAVCFILEIFFHITYDLSNQLEYKQNYYNF